MGGTPQKAGTRTATPVRRSPSGLGTTTPVSRRVDAWSPCSLTSAHRLLTVTAAAVAMLLGQATADCWRTRDTSGRLVRITPDPFAWEVARWRRCPARLCSAACRVVIDNTIPEIPARPHQQACSITTLDLSSATALQKIQDRAFESCVRLTTIDFSGATALQSIGRRAFYRSALTTLDLSSATTLHTIEVAAFQKSSSLTIVDLSGASALQTIGYNVFASCSALATVDLGSTVQSIGQSAFIRTPAATAGTICWIPPDTSGRVVVPADMRWIPDRGFYWCSTVVTVDLSGATLLQTIGQYAFKSCSRLTTLDLSGAAALQNIETAAFDNCSSLTTIDFSGAGALQAIHGGAFRNCSSLATIDFSGATALQTIVGMAFMLCSSLTTVDYASVPANVSIGPEAFDGSGCSDAIGALFGCREVQVENCAPRLPDTVSEGGCAADYVRSLKRGEDGRQVLFLAVGVGLLALAVLYAYCCGAKNLSGWKTTRFLIFGVALRLGDMLSDVAFNVVNLGIVGNDENLFYLRYEGDADTIRVVSAVFLIIGCLLTPVDVRGSYRRLELAGDGGGADLARLWRVTLAISLLEDVPQLVVNGIYVNAVGIEKEGSGAAITVMSLALSVCGLAYSVYTICGDCRRRQGRVLVPDPGSTRQRADQFTDGDDTHPPQPTQDRVRTCAYAGGRTCSRSVGLPGATSAGDTDEALYCKDHARARTTNPAFSIRGTHREAPSTAV